MIKFKRIFWKNLLSTGNSGIEIDFESTKTTILFGPSGSGKSTLLDAITFCLFNKPFRNINKPKLVNAINERDCLVSVEFSSQGKNYRVVRGIKPNIFEIYVNDVLFNQDANNRDYQDFLENNILKINYKTFLQVVMLGAANFTPFMQLKPSDRRQIIEDLLDIQVFSSMNAILKEKISIAKQELLITTSELNGTTEKLDMGRKYLQDIKERNKTKIVEIRSKIDSLNIEIQTLVESKQSLIADKEKITIDSIKSIEKQLQTFNKLKITFENNIKRLEKDVEFYNNNLNCPTCKQHISEETKIQELEIKQKGLNDAKLGIQKLEESILDVSEKKQIILSNQEELQKIENKIREIDWQLEYKNKTIKSYEEEIENIDKQDEDLLYYKNLCKQLIETKMNLHKKKQELLSQMQIMDYSNLILKDNGVKSKIIKEYIPYINQYVNLFLNSMSFFVSFKLDENFEEQIKSKGRDFFNYENFSEGERQRLDLALLFTWRCIAKSKNSVNTNLLIMDEIFDSYLDTTATENVLSIFKEEIFADSNIIVISHKENIVDKFDRVVKYRIERGFSRMEL